MQEQLMAQLIAMLKERVGLSEEQASQAAAAVAEFAQQNLPSLLQVAQERTGVSLPAGLGDLFGGLMGGER